MAAKEKPREEETLRLNKVIAMRSRYSRREADRLIEEGRVNINRQKVTQAGITVPVDAPIYIDGKPLKPQPEGFTVIAYNKPKGELVTKKDPQGRKTIYHSLPSRFGHFIPVGRLDYASEGLLLLTDSAEVAEILMRSDLERVYNIKIDGFVTPPMEQAMNEGITLSDARAGGHEKSRVRSMEFAPFVAWRVEKNHPNYSRLKLVLSEGKNREIRRFFAHFDRVVLDLKRVSYGKVSLSALPEGKSRFLERSEYNWLHGFLSEARKKAKRKSSEKNDPQESLQNGAD
jgi:23S rRNA pseudouridine2605 synthase